MSNLSRFVAIMWVFVVLVLTSSYTATLTSMLTVQQINLNSKTNHIGCSFISGCTSNFNFQNFNLWRFDSAEEYAEALSRGSKDGGVSVIVDEIPYIKLFLAKYGNHYSMIGSPLSTTNGFAFVVFPKGSQMVHMSWAIATLREEGRLIKMEKTMLNTQTDVTFGDSTDINVIPLTLERFQGLFLISGRSSVLALTIFSLFVLRSKWHSPVKHYDHLIGQKFKSIKRYMSEKMIFTGIRGEPNVVHPV